MGISHCNMEFDIIILSARSLSHEGFCYTLNRRTADGQTIQSMAWSVVTDISDQLVSCNDKHTHQTNTTERAVERVKDNINKRATCSVHLYADIPTCMESIWLSSCENSYQHQHFAGKTQHCPHRRHVSQHPRAHYPHKYERSLSSCQKEEIRKATIPPTDKWSGRQRPLSFSHNSGNWLPWSLWTMGHQMPALYFWSNLPKAYYWNYHRSLSHAPITFLIWETAQVGTLTNISTLYSLCRCIAVFLLFLVALPSSSPRKPPCILGCLQHLYIYDMLVFVLISCTHIHDGISLP